MTNSILNLQNLQNVNLKFYFSRLTMTDEDRAKMAKKNDKKKGNKKSVDLKVKQDIDLKERVIREERIRLQNEAFKIKLVCNKLSFLSMLN